MSHIATALAKSKGREVKPPPTSTLEDVPLARVGPVENPFLQTVATKKIEPVIYTAPTAADRKFPIRRLILALGLIVLGVLAVIGWTMLGDQNPLADLFPGSKPPPLTMPLPVAGQSKAGPAKGAFAAATDPSEQIRDTVRKFQITSVAGGSIQRLTLGGKVYQPGDTVADGIVLQAIELEEIVFRDTAGNLYTRRL